MERLCNIWIAIQCCCKLCQKIYKNSNFGNHKMPFYTRKTHIINVTLPLSIVYLILKSSSFDRHGSASLAPITEVCDFLIYSTWFWKLWRRFVYCIKNLKFTKLMFLIVTECALIKLLFQGYGYGNWRGRLRKHWIESVVI